MKIRKFRYIEKGHGSDSLSVHEIEELDIDFDIQTYGYYVLVLLTKEEWNFIKEKKGGE